MSEPLRPQSFEGKSLDEALPLLSPQCEGTLRPVLESFLDDDPSGDKTRFDRGVEITSLFEELLKYPECFEQPLWRMDLEDYRQAILPARMPDADEVVDAENRGEDLRGVSESPRQAGWQSHFERNRHGILEAVKLVEAKGVVGIGDRNPERRPVVMVLGAGGCYDIPLAELAEKFRVILVDLDEAAMKRALKRLPQEQRRYVSYEVRDLSGGLVLNVMGRAKHIEEDASLSETDKRLAVSRLLAEHPVPLPHLEGTDDVALLISSMLVSQIPEYIIDSLGGIGSSAGDMETYRRVEGEFARGAADFSQRVFRAHADALGDFLARGPKRAVYFATELIHYKPRPVPRASCAVTDFFRELFDMSPEFPKFSCQGGPWEDDSILFLFSNEGHPLRRLDRMTDRLRLAHPELRRSMFWEWNWNNSGNPISEILGSVDNESEDHCRLVNAVVWHTADR